ncbi:MAG: pyridoxal phosphate-dependent aminotransferase [Dehalococcoidia bacterium]|tara:strand:- start:15010 stop:16197 length:1188 start_codon:yes stop_codon:yes gene_type:complete
MSISKKIHKFIEEGGWIRKMFESGIILKEQYGSENVFDLSLGNPVIEPPQEFHEALLKLASNPRPGMHRYMPNAGYQNTRDVIANSIAKESKVNLTGNNIIMTCGAAAALNVTLKTILDPKEEVIILSPFFVEYEYYIDNHGGKPVIVPTNPDFSLNMDDIEKSITSRTRAIIINSPNNPTGVVYNEKTYQDLSEIFIKKQKEHNRTIYIISDEPYRKIVFGSTVCPHWFNYYDNSIIVHSHAKDLALPGERIGYIAVSPHSAETSLLIDGLTFSNRILGFVNAPALMQNLVEHLQSTVVDPQIYETKMNFLYSELTEMGYQITKPQGAFYLFPKSPIKDDAVFTEELLAEKVLVVPGRGFGSPGHFRISYCVEDSVIEGSLQGFKKVSEKYHMI